MNFVYRQFLLLFSPEPVFLRQLLKIGETVDNRLIADAVSDPHIAGAGKAGTGHHQNMILLGPLHKLLFVLRGRFYE